MKLASVLSLSGITLLALSSAAQAELTGNVALTSDYDFRGISQTTKDPALQGGVDYIDHTRGWYVGAWGSNVDFKDGTDLQLNTYTGFIGKTDIGVGWNAGIVYRAYDESRHNYPEIYAAFDYSYFTAKVSYAHNYLGSYVPGNTHAVYVSADADVPVPVPNLSVLGHVGHTTADNDFKDYTDFFVGVKYKVDKFDLSLRYVDTDLSPHRTSDLLNDEGRFVFAVSTKLPW